MKKLLKHLNIILFLLLAIYGCGEVATKTDYNYQGLGKGGERNLHNEILNDFFTYFDSTNYNAYADTFITNNYSIGDTLGLSDLYDILSDSTLFSYSSSAMASALDDNVSLTTSEMADYLSDFEDLVTDTPNSYKSNIGILEYMECMDTLLVSTIESATNCNASDVAAFKAILAYDIQVGNGTRDRSLVISYMQNILDNNTKLSKVGKKTITFLKEDYQFWFVDHTEYLDLDDVKTMLLKIDLYDNAGLTIDERVWMYTRDLPSSDAAALASYLDNHNYGDNDPAEDETIYCDAEIQAALYSANAEAKKQLLKFVLTLISNAF